MLGDVHLHNEEDFLNSFFLEKEWKFEGVRNLPKTS